MGSKVAALLAIAVVLPAQNAQPMRVGTRLVEVEVIANEKDGPARNLTQEDFTVLDKGKVQKIAVFQTNRPAAGNAVQALPPGTITNRPSLRMTDSGSATETVVLLDRLNTEFADQVYARQQMVRFLRSLRPQDQVAIYVLGNKLSVLQDFTDDPQILARALKSLGGAFSPQLSVSDPNSSAVQADAIASTGDSVTDAAVAEMNQAIQNSLNDLAAFNIRDRVDKTLKALTEIARHMSGQAGRKSLVWISGSFPLQIEDRGPVTFTNEVAQAVRALNEADIAVYPIDARGLVPPKLPDVASRTVPSARPAAVGLPGIDTMLTLARSTGGKAFYNTNDVIGAVREAVRDADSTYTLGFYPPESALDGKFHSLTVKVARKGVETRYRKGYYALSDTQRPSESDRQHDLGDLFSSPLNATAIRMVANVSPNPAVAGEYRVVVAFDPKDLHYDQKDDHWLASAELSVHLESDKATVGKAETLNIDIKNERLQVVLNQDFVRTLSIRATARVDYLRVAVIDRASGAAGSLRLRLAAQ